ncbi:IS3 family transposase [Pseudostreptobacillus hongkongensis]
MSRPGKCPDNSPIESFWGILKSELVYNEIVRFNKLNREEAIESIEKYIEYYNNERIRIKEIAL